jgi:GNAT superfamily N-acetyltransferase
MKPDYKLVAKAKYIHLTADLATEIWHECYKRYYTPKQLDAILAELQSPEAIEEQIDDEVNYFIVNLGAKPIGYFAWKMENTALHLIHLYLKPEYRGKALGRDIVSTCERLARSEGKGRVWCTVHTRALPVQQFFKARGYRPLRPGENTAAGITLDEIEMEHILR